VKLSEKNMSSCLSLSLSLSLAVLLIFFSNISNELELSVGANLSSHFLVPLCWDSVGHLHTQ
jgi:hypothetical protein